MANPNNRPERDTAWLLRRNPDWRNTVWRVELHILLCIQCQIDKRWHRAMWHYGRAKWLSARMEGMGIAKYGVLTDVYADCRRRALAVIGGMGHLPDLPAFWLEKPLTREQANAMIWAYEEAMGGARLPDGEGYDYEVVQQMYNAALTVPSTKPKKSGRFPS